MSEIESRWVDASSGKDLETFASSSDKVFEVVTSGDGQDELSRLICD